MDIFSKSEAETAMEKSESGMRKEGDRIIVSGPGFNRSWIESTFEITLPEGFSCDVESKGGSIDIAGLKGDVDASTGGGSVTLADIESNVDHPHFVSRTESAGDPSISAIFPAQDRDGKWSFRNWDAAAILC